MPTWERTTRFDRDREQLGADDRDRFRRAVGHFTDDLRRGRLRRGLPVKRVQGTDDVYEMSWAPDGRATFQCGAAGKGGAHVIWHRVGRHKVLRRL